MSIGSARPVAARPRWHRKLGVPRLSAEASLLIGVIAAFIAVSAWWLTQDQRVPVWDSGTHLLYALSAESQLRHGELGALFNTWDLYPPFGAVVGAIGLWIGGFTPMAAILAANIVFVPLLACACYGIGTLVYGARLAGLLAAVFALGTPMFVSQMHVMMLDPQEAAMVAATIWGVLASRGFSRPYVAALAGLAAGLAVMTKQTAIIFIAGPVLIAVLRGRLRSWRGILAFVVIAGIVAAPWYISHWEQIRLQGASDDLTNTSAYASPPRFSRESLTWYFWDALNIQILLPLCAFFAVGVLMTLRDWLPRPKASDLRIDLLAGCFIGWLGVTMVVHKDPRYSLSELVYIAVLGSGWVATLTRRWARAGIASLLVVIATVNFLGVSLGIGSTQQTALPGHTPGQLQKLVTYYSPAGYLAGGPEVDGDIPSLMKDLAGAGYSDMTVDVGVGQYDFNQSGLDALAGMIGLTQTPLFEPGKLGPRGFMFELVPPTAGDPPPCRTLDDGAGVYVAVGDAAVPFELTHFFCPGRHPAYYERTAPPSPATVAQVEPSLPEPWRSRFITLFRAMRSQGIKEVQVDPDSSDVPYFAGSQTLKLASSVGLIAGPFDPATRDVHEAFLLRHPDGRGEPQPCLRLPEGTGLYIVLGYAYILFQKYEFYCPTHTPRMYSAGTS
jgi:4-amino-4-deoxy-L-arabinose transferase-like glycosyltransferase